MFELVAQAFSHVFDLRLHGGQLVADGRKLLGEPVRGAVNLAAFGAREACIIMTSLVGPRQLGAGKLCTRAVCLRHNHSP